MHNMIRLRDTPYILHTYICRRSDSRLDFVWRQKGQAAFRDECSFVSVCRELFLF